MFLQIISILILLTLVAVILELRKIKTSISNLKGQDNKVYISDEPAYNDELLEEAKKIVLESGKASASYLQRRLSIGYARSAYLIDQMEELGLIGPARGAEPREILAQLKEAK
ncbi:MAG: DNA translocase FtsK [Candidatus Staskawiczbacteria bacterium]|nr:DNA translocase FtsK [Candidatus Staskawiczbacteria bacterium]